MVALQRHSFTVMSLLGELYVVGSAIFNIFDIYVVFSVYGVKSQFTFFPFYFLSFFLGAYFKRVSYLSFINFSLLFFRSYFPLIPFNSF